MPCTLSPANLDTLWLLKTKHGCFSADSWQQRTYLLNSTTVLRSLFSPYYDWLGFTVNRGFSVLLSLMESVPSLLWCCLLTSGKLLNQPGVSARKLLKSFPDGIFISISAHHGVTLFLSSGPHQNIAFLHVPFR